ncbi:MAG: molybdopterin dinucleotide binding domain-containing protein [Candidatus Thorarchaeota archaeon]
MALGDFLFPHAELNLVIARSFESDIESVKDKQSQEYIDTTALIRMHSGDLKRLGLQDERAASVKSDIGNVIVRVFGDDKIPEGTAVMPYGPWALSLVSVPTDSSPPQFHGIKITVTKSDDSVTTLDSLFDS